LGLKREKKVALNKEKLENVAYTGFGVENLEVMERQLREVLASLNHKKYREAHATASAIAARAVNLEAQCQRWADATVEGGGQ
jgi:hypothetical protein